MTDDYMRITIMTLCAAAVLTAGPAVAKVVATCGESAGHAWYYEGALVPKSKSGWVADRISGGGFQIIRSSDDYDLVFTDATGGTKSSKWDGGVVIGENPEVGRICRNDYLPRSLNRGVRPAWRGGDIFSSEVQLAGQQAFPDEGEL